MDNNIKKVVSFDDTLIGNKNIIDFDVPGDPFGKQRPRAARKGRFITIYTPRETKEYENKVIKYYNKYYKGTKLEGPINVKINGIFGIPKSVSKYKAEKMINKEIPHTKKPDCDNLAKSILDALNNVAYNDDAQITKLEISKEYAIEGKAKILIKEEK
mgnify:CR=1 FL=1